MQSKPSEIRLVDGEIAIIFPYVAEQVTAVKRIPGARWDRLAKVWRAPITSLTQVRQFATRYNFGIDPDLTGFLMPKHPVGEARIEKGRTRLHIYFPYDPVKVKAVKKLPGAAWDSKGKRWTTPLMALPDALDFATEYDLNVPDLDHLNELRIDLAERTNYFTALSRAYHLQEPDFAGVGN